MSDFRDLKGFYYAVMSGLPGTTKGTKTKSFPKLSQAESHVHELQQRFPKVSCDGYYKVSGTVPNEAADRTVNPADQPSDGRRSPSVWV